MKTCWEFRFEVTGFRFSRKIRYEVSSELTNQQGTPLPDFAETFYVEIVPDEESNRHHVDETGSFKLTFNGTPKKTKEFAYWAAHELACRISFEQGNMDIAAGLVTWEQIPETEEERKMIGDTPFGVELQLQEAVEPPRFDPASIGKHVTNEQYSRLMSQFNESKRSQSPVECFLGCFRIIEFLYSGYDGNNKLEKALLAAEPLRRHVKDCTVQPENGEPLSDEQCSEIIKKLYTTRHRCAHLRGKFGIVSCDKEMRTIVMPLLPVVGEAARRGIMARYNIVKHSEKMG